MRKTYILINILCYAVLILGVANLILLTLKINGSL